jgi:hypothetical protein
MEGAQEAVLVKSEDLPEGTPTVKGYDFTKGVHLDLLLESYKYTGFQGTQYFRMICVNDEIYMLYADVFHVGCTYVM